MQVSEHAAEVLVGHGAEYGVRGGIKAHGVQVGHECGDGVRIMGNVQDQRGLPRHDLETAGKRRLCQADAHVLRGHR